MKLTAKEMILAAEFAAITAVLSQITVPMGVIPFTMQTFAVGLVATTLGWRLGTISIGIYLLLGLIGVPVFAGFSGGIHVLFGPTGGYLVGFIINGLVTGWLNEKKPGNYSWSIAANLLGAILTLFFGTFWYQISGSLTFTAAMTGGFWPFVLPGIVKAVAAALLGTLLMKRVPMLQKLYH